MNKPNWKISDYDLSQPYDGVKVFIKSAIWEQVCRKYQVKQIRVFERVVGKYFTEHYQNKPELKKELTKEFSELYDEFLDDYPELVDTSYPVLDFKSTWYKGKLESIEVTSIGDEALRNFKVEDWI